MLSASHFSIIARFFVKDGDEIFCETEEAKVPSEVFLQEKFFYNISPYTQSLNFFTFSFVFGGVGLTSDVTKKIYDIL